MKDAPPLNLLGPGQSWVIVEDPNWTVAGKALHGGNYRCGYYEAGVVCHADAVASPIGTTVAGRPLCDQHIGSIRWWDPDANRVLQWRANPPWDYLIGQVEMAREGTS